MLITPREELPLTTCFPIHWRDNRVMLVILGFFQNRIIKPPLRRVSVHRELPTSRTLELQRVTRQQPPPTRPTLLGALRDGLRWEEFVALYGPLILTWGRCDFGLQASDADNLCQEVLLRVWRRIGSFDPARGRFRAWLYACARNAASNLRRCQCGERVGALPPSDGRDRALPDGDDMDAALTRLEENGFDVDDLQRAVSAVRARVQPATWKAFLVCEFFDLTAREAGALLGMQPVAVNQAVFRIRQMLRDCLAGGPNRRPSGRGLAR
jgi:RNA polymerase sigma-70 factor (ECF subfamily)